MRVALALVLAAACGPATSPTTSPVVPLSNTGQATADPHEPMATIQHTACFGWCPVYKVTIFRDGVVEYEGERYVKTRGRATGHLAPAQLAALEDLFRTNRYLDLDDAYREYSVTDLPSVHTSYAPAGKNPKRIEHYLGDRSAPESLLEVEHGIDRIIDVEQWIGTRDERLNGARE